MTSSTMQHVDENGVPTIRSSLPMALFGFALVMHLAIRPIFIERDLSAALGGVDSWGESVPNDWRLTYGVLGGMQVALFVLLVATAFSYFRRRRTARWLAVASIICTIIVNICIAAYSLSLAGGDDDYIAQTVSSTLRICLVAIAWLVYFLVSKRVRQTLDYPLSA